MKKKIVTIIATMTMIMASMLAGCADTKTDTKDVSRATETVEVTENVSDTADVVESTGIATESESADVSAADNEYPNIYFDEEGIPKFINHDNMVDTTISNENFQLNVSYWQFLKEDFSDIYELAAALQKIADEYAETVSGTTEPTRTYEVVTINDFELIKYTSQLPETEDLDEFSGYKTVFYYLPLKNNGYYTSNNVEIPNTPTANGNPNDYRVVFAINFYPYGTEFNITNGCIEENSINITDYGVQEALKLLN